MSCQDGRFEDPFVAEVGDRFLYRLANESGDPDLIGASDRFKRTRGSLCEPNANDFCSSRFAQRRATTSTTTML